jgi:hypothetical protein
MPNDSEALAAIDGLNEKELDEKVIVVKPANAKPLVTTDRQNNPCIFLLMQLNRILMHITSPHA